MPDKSVVRVDKQGLVIDTNLFGAPKDPELYTDDSGKFTVRKYVEITCARRKDKSIDTSAEALKTVTEDLVVLNAELNTPSRDNSSNGVNNGSRTGKATNGSTPNGYAKPDWANDSTQTTSK